MHLCFAFIFSHLMLSSDIKRVHLQNIQKYNFNSNVRKMALRKLLLR